MSVYQTDLGLIAEESKRRADDYAAFRYYVELDERSDAELDALVEDIAAPIIDGIDCTQCANCCRSLDVYVTPDDAHRLSTVIALDTIIDHERAQADEEWGMLRDKPCRFLDGKLCSIYAHRPDSCRLYPVFTPDFRWTVEEVLGGVGLCPIIYNVIEELQRVLGW